MIDARGKNVIVLGGGDTGADCVATAHRQGAQQVVQISINPKVLDRPSDNTWPEWPLIYRKTYAIEEGGVEESSEQYAFARRGADHGFTRQGAKPAAQPDGVPRPDAQG